LRVGNALVAGIDSVTECCSILKVQSGTIECGNCATAVHQHGQAIPLAVMLVLLS